MSKKVMSEWAWVGDTVLHAFPADMRLGHLSWSSHTALCGRHFGALNGCDGRRKKCRDCVDKRKNAQDPA